MKITEFIKDNKVYFDSYRSGFFYYNVKRNHSMEYYQFPVPVEDVGNATLLANDKAITFMRWIRKAMDDGTFIKSPLSL